VAFKVRKLPVPKMIKCYEDIPNGFNSTFTERIDTMNEHLDWQNSATGNVRRQLFFYRAVRPNYRASFDSYNERTGNSSSSSFLNEYELMVGFNSRVEPNRSGALSLDYPVWAKKPFLIVMKEDIIKDKKKKEATATSVGAETVTTDEGIVLSMPRFVYGAVTDEPSGFTGTSINR